MQNLKIYNLKTSLGYIVKTRRGYQKDLPITKDEIESFKMTGFINTGRTLREDTYSITKLADQYYTDVFGVISYLLKRIQGFFHS